MPPSDRHERGVWVDTDGGADDAVALLTLVGAGVRLVGVSTVGGVVDAATAAANAAGVLAAAGAVGPDGGPVPVHVGGAHHGVDGIGGSGLGDPGAVHPRDGVGALLDATRRDERLDVLALGPHTNLATASTRAPDLPARLGRVVLVAGPGAVRDTNTWHDPAATARVLTGFGPAGRLTVVTATATWSDPLDGAAPRVAAADPGDGHAPARSTPSPPGTSPATPASPASPASPVSPASLASLAAAVAGGLRRSQSVVAGRDLLVPHDALAAAVWAEADTTAEVTVAGGSVVDGVAVPTGAGRIRWVWRLDGAAAWVARQLAEPPA